MERLNEKVAIITGAASGIGKATALLFAKEGATVIVTDLNKENIDVTVNEIVAAGGKATGHVLNVADRAQWSEVVQAVCQAYGKIDIVVNNAGMSLEIPFADVTDDQWNKVMDVNVRSIFIAAQEVFPKMIENGGGAFVNVASMAGLLGNCGAGPYTASKSALISFTKSLAQDYAKQTIRVNNVCPGYIATDMTKHMFADENYAAYFYGNTPLPYLGEADDIANAIVFLASDEAKFITGVSLSVDGGIAAK